MEVLVRMEKSKFKIRHIIFHKIRFPQHGDTCKRCGSGNLRLLPDGHWVCLDCNTQN